MASSDSLSLAMVAGELSGDILAGRMLSALRPQLPDARMHGIGGPNMMQHGFISDWPQEKLAVRGLFEVLAHFREIKGIRDDLRDRLLAEKPAVFVGIDAPEFNIGLELQLRQAGIPTVHFVSPSIWGWRRGRIDKIRQAVSHMLVVFPFEEQLYRDAGVPVTYVGHPLAEVIPLEPDVAAARRQLGIAPDATVVAILPGSRLSELNYHAAAFIGAARILAQRDPSITFITPMVGERQRQHFIGLLDKLGLKDVPLTIVEGQSHAVIAAADVVLVSSGTATLEVALFKKPMVVAYKVMWATWQIVRRMVYTRWCALPNIIEQEALVPEFLQEQATPEALAEALWQQLHDEANRKVLRQRFIDLHHALLRNTAEISAQAVMQVMRRS
ncbi:MAG: lipid-A-disaccharide synthase [Burkholderiaceae bacterium]|nr:lipid-A-disaccharide synthase [Burkholderiaceae bacterium]